MSKFEPRSIHEMARMADQMEAKSRETAFPIPPKRMTPSDKLKEYFDRNDPNKVILTTFQWDIEKEPRRLGQNEIRIDFLWRNLKGYVVVQGQDEKGNISQLVDFLEQLDKK